MGRYIGYARVSREEQNLELQMNALKSAGCNKEHTFTDKVSGVKAERPGLAQCLEILNTGDTLIVWRLDRSQDRFVVGYGLDYKEYYRGRIA